MLYLELYFSEEEMDKVLCCAKNRSDFRVISALISYLQNVLRGSKKSTVYTKKNNVQ